MLVLCYLIEIKNKIWILLTRNATVQLRVCSRVPHMFLAPPLCSLQAQLPMEATETYPICRASRKGQVIKVFNLSPLTRGICVQLLSPVRLFVIPWTLAHQAPLSLEFARQEYWSGYCRALLQGIFPTQGLNLGLPHCRQTLYYLSQQERPPGAFSSYIVGLLCSLMKYSKVCVLHFYLGPPRTHPSFLWWQLSDLHIFYFSGFFPLSQPCS